MIEEKTSLVQKLKDLFRYFLTAVFGAGINFFAQIPFKTWFLNIPSMHEAAYEWSIFAAYMTATVLTFIPAKLYAFKSKNTGNAKRETIKWVIIATLALGVQEFFSIITLNEIANKHFYEFSLLAREKASHFIGMGFSFLTNFFGHKYLTFKSTGIYDKYQNRKLNNK